MILSLSHLLYLLLHLQKLAYEFPTNALYSGRRIWRAMDLMAPSLQLDHKLGWIPYMKTYPFSIVPDNKLTAADLMAVLRDTYEGSQFDISIGTKGGPFSSPLQYDPPHYDNYTIHGGWERPIAVYRMLYSFVAVCRSWLPDHIGGKVWLALGRSTSSVYVPFYAGHEVMPESYLVGKESELNHKSTWWAFAFVANFAQLKWNLMWPDIRAEQRRLETSMFNKVEEAESKALRINESLGTDESIMFLQRFSNTRAAKVTEAWWSLGFALVTKFHDGFITTGESAGRPRPGYPKWWLEATQEYSGWPENTFTDQRTPDMCGGEIPGLSSLAEATVEDSEAMSMTGDIAHPAEAIEAPMPHLAGTSVTAPLMQKLAAIAAVSVMAGLAIGYAAARMQHCPASESDMLRQPLLQ